MQPSVLLGFGVDQVTFTVDQARLSWRRYRVLSGMPRPLGANRLRARLAHFHTRVSAQAVCRVQTVCRLTLPGRAA
jgi:hypothetical protein